MTLQRGSQAFPPSDDDHKSGPMKVEKSVSPHVDLFEAVRPKPKREENRSLSRGTSALPDGPMFFEGTTNGELGKIYRRRD